MCIRDSMKLEKWVIDRKQKVMEEEGVKFVVNADVGKTVKAADIVKDYDSVILACGASNPRDIKAVSYTHLICKRIPTPSPVFPSASLPARCSSFSTRCV